MDPFETLDSALVDEILHGDDLATLRVSSLRARVGDDGPALAIERTTLPDGPTRPPVLLVHGFAQNRYTWRISRRSMSGYLARAGYDVLNLELRGHGNSRALGAGNATAFEDYVDDVVGIVEALPERPFLIGHSLGAGVGIGVATRTELRGLVHLAGLYHFARFNRTIRAVSRVTRRVEPALLSARVRTRWAGKLLGRLYRLTDVSGYVMPLAGWAPGSMERDLLEERLDKGFDWTSVEVWLQMARWAGGEDFAYAADWKKTDVPVFVLAGDQDPLVTPDDARVCFEESGSADKVFVEFEPFEHAVHWGHVDLIVGRHAPHHVWPAILEWLDAR